MKSKEKVVIREVFEREKLVWCSLPGIKPVLENFPLGKVLDKYSVQKKKVEHLYICKHFFQIANEVSHYFSTSALIAKWFFQFFSIWKERSAWD